MKKFPYFEIYAYTKPFSKHELVEECFDESYTLFSLAMSPYEAEKMGFVCVTSGKKGNQARWTEKKYIGLFEKAEAYIKSEVEKSALELEKLKSSEIFENQTEIRTLLLEKLDSRFDKDTLLKDLAAIKSQYEAVAKEVDEFVESFSSLTSLDQQIKEEYIRFEAELREKKELFFKPLELELEEISSSFEACIDRLSKEGSNKAIREDYFQGLQETNSYVSEDTVLEYFVEYLISKDEELKSFRKTSFNEVKKQFKKLKRKLNLKQTGKAIVELQKAYTSFSDDSLAIGFSKRKPSKSLLGLKIVDLFELSLEKNINRKNLTQSLKESFPILGTEDDDYDFSSELGVRELGSSGHMIHYKFKFSNFLTKLQASFSGRYEWTVNCENKFTTENSDKGLIICSRMFLSQASFMINVDSFRRSNDFVKKEDLEKKKNKFKSSIEFFVSKNFEKEGFDEFCQTKSLFHCKSMKQAKNFSSFLEKSFSDFCLARLATNYADIFSVRSNERIRNIIYYSGPTNSGKSYKAFEELAKHKTGVYLGPLRLLALEGVEELTKRGKKTNLVTGEEKQLVEGATHSSQTIETYNRDEKYDCVIIDEIQLISDEGRGGAFMEALLNINADTVVLTGSQDAVGLVREICEKTGDLFSNIKLTRKNPLKWVGNFKIANEPNESMKGTAIVAFSKRAIHNIRNILLNKGYSVSVIYGALSPDVRRSEAERFRKGETDILVATDAIGLGLNLPIKRVLFSESDKFDGQKIRNLTPTEILQIGGRAGRFGMFQENGEVGYVEGFSRFGVEEWVLETGFKKTLKKLKSVYVSITYKQLSESYTSLDKGLSQIIKTLMAKNLYSWSKAKPAEIVDMERLSKAVLIEDVAESLAEDLDLPALKGDKILRHLDVSFNILFRLLNTPFDVDLNEDLLARSFRNVLRVVAGLKVVREELVNDVSDLCGSKELEYAENFVRELTLHYYFAVFFESLDQYPYSHSPEEILVMRKNVGIKIAEYLAKNESVDGFSGGRAKRQSSYKHKNNRSNFRKRKK